MKKTLFSVGLIILIGVGVFFLIKKGVPGDETPTERLTIAILEEGSGDPIQTGQTAVVHYTGTLIDGTVFDSSVIRGTPFEFMYGTGRVISGWDKGLENMRAGEKRRLVIPPSYGYGDKEMGPIPANSTLIFDVELIEIK